MLIISTFLMVRWKWILHYSESGDILWNIKATRIGLYDYFFSFILLSLSSPAVSEITLPLGTRPGAGLSLFTPFFFCPYWFMCCTTGCKCGVIIKTRAHRPRGKFAAGRSFGIGSRLLRAQSPLLWNRLISYGTNPYRRPFDKSGFQQAALPY